MSLLSTNVLRTVTYTTDMYGYSSYQISAGVDTEGSYDDSSKTTYYPLGQPAYVSVDDFWGGTALASRTVSLLMRQSDDKAPVDDSVIEYPVTRTVSDLARDNITEDLSLDDEESILYAPEQKRTYSQASTASEDERPVKKIRIFAKPVTQRTSNPEPKSVFSEEPARVQLGEHGRQRLKSLLSSAVKYDAAKRDLVYAIGKVKLASIPQLLQMARVCGLWDEVMNIANTSFQSRR